MSRRTITVLLCLFFIAYLACGVFLVYYGRYTGDEGWYAYISDIVWQGKRPYQDFLYTQTPVLPYFYGAFFNLLGRDLYIGRWISLGCTTAGLALIVAVAIRRGSLLSGLISLILLSTNLSFIFDTISIKTQGLTGLWLALTIYFAALADSDNWWGIPANIFAALALLTRLSMLPLMVLLWVYLWRTYRPAYGRLFLSLFPGTAILAGVICHFLSYNMWFGIIGMHRILGMYKNWGTAKLFLTGFLSNQLVICLLLVSLSLFSALSYLKNLKKHVAPGLVPGLAGDKPPRYVLKSSKKFSLIKFDFEAFVLASYICISLVHLAAPELYPIYQTSIIFLAVLWVSVKLSRIARQCLSDCQLSYPISVLILLCLLSINFQEHGITPDPGRNLAGIDRIARIIRELPANPKRLISFDPGVAFQSGVPMLPGYEAGDFSFFPYMTDKYASDFRVTNLNSLRRQIADGQAGILALRPRDIASLAPQDSQDITRLINRKYTLVKSVKRYGQFGEEMDIFVRGEG